MKKDRRQFLKKSATAALGLSTLPFIRCTKPIKKPNILILGGTNFLGPATVEAALKKDFDVALFNRGVTNPNLFPDLPLIIGDRQKGGAVYGPLIKRHWDLVIDVWPEKSKLVDEASEALKNNAGHYIFISSIAVYQDFQEVGLHEKSAVLELPGNLDDWYYGEEKLMAEKLVAERFPNNHTIIRPGPIKGWRDPAMDLSYWLVKLKKDNPILAPGSGKDPLQFVDVKDVGRFAIFAFENNLNGVFNCTGPRKEQLLWEDFLNLAKSHLNSSSRLSWASEDFLRANNIRSFEDLPLWAPLSEDRGFMQISQEKMLASGFQHSPIENTLDDCLAWLDHNGMPDPEFGTEERPVGLSRERELELIEMINVSSGK